jgi:hypothetical protein
LKFDQAHLLLIQLFQFTHPSLEEQALYLVLRSAVLGHPAPISAEKLTSQTARGRVASGRIAASRFPFLQLKVGK